MRDRLYNLLPVIYRQKDLELEQGEPLRAYLNILEHVSDSVERDIDTLYDDWFIETCQDRIIPWIGELVGSDLAMSQEQFLPSYRTYVANTLAYRRRKGTVSVLARVIQDLTGWEATVVEFFDRLSITQSLSLQDVGEGGTFSIRNVAASEWVDSPFNLLAARSVDIRTQSVSSNSGGMIECAPFIDPEAGIGLKNVGIYIARLRSFPIVQATPHAHSDVQNGYWFNPLGQDMALFNMHATLRNLTDIRQEVDMSLPLRRLVLEAEWLDRKQSKNWTGPGYFGNTPVFSIWIQDGHGVSRQLHPAEFCIRDLKQWHCPEPGSGIQAFVDPELGRFTLAQACPANVIRTSYYYGFSANIGAGPYERKMKTIPTESPVWKASVSTSVGTSQPPFYACLAEALTDAQNCPAGQPIQITILDSATYHLDLSCGLDSQLLSIEAVQGQRPCLSGTLSVASSNNGGSLSINGCLLKNSLQVAGNLRVSLANCTLKPKCGHYSIRSCPQSVLETIKQVFQENKNKEIDFDVHDLAFEITHSIIGRIGFDTGEVRLDFADSIIDGAGVAAISPNCNRVPSEQDEVIKVSITASFQRCTLLGSVQINTLTSAIDSIFTQPIRIVRRNQGYLCYCFVPHGSLTPVRFRCQPDLTLESAQNLAEVHNDILLKLRPVFSSTEYGIPSYAQLGLSCPDSIRRGAENGSEMGAFHHLNTMLREQGLKKALEEYLPYGLDAEVFCMS